MHDRRDGGARRPEVAVALDFPDGDQALAMVDRLAGGTDLYKVGLELFTRSGPHIVERLRARGKRVFLDLKLHDIPATVRGAVRAASGLGVELLTVHASGGREMIRAAREAADDGPTRILAVTVLTSLGPRELGLLHRREAADVAGEVLHLAKLALDAGAHGLVSSVGEVRAIRAAFGGAPLVVSPGIRLPGDDHHDQSRVATPGDAVASGADVLVVGRSVTGSVDPPAALKRLRTGMLEGLEAGVGAGSRDEATVEEG